MSVLWSLLPILVVVIWLGIVIYTSYRDSKKITIDSEFALRLLPAGSPLVLEEQWITIRGYRRPSSTLVATKTRKLTLTDARIAYKSYLLICERAFDQLMLPEYMASLLTNSPEFADKQASRDYFFSIWDFVRFVSLFDASLADTLKNRTVDPSEYELAKSGWNEEEED